MTATTSSGAHPVSLLRRRFQSWFDDIAVSRPGAPPRRFDWIVVALLAAGAVAEWVFVPFPNQIMSVLPAVVAIAVLPVRRQIPLPVALLAFFTQFASEVIAGVRDTPSETTYSQSIAGLMLVYALCRWASPRAVAVGFAIISVLVFIGELILLDATRAVDWLEAALFAIPWAILAAFALAMRYRARLAENREAQIRLTERNALARELHDTVAHHVSAIAVQAQAAQYIAKTNPDAATEAMQAVEQIANTTIDEMRRMVGILRSDDDQARSVTASSLVDLQDPAGEPKVTMVGATDLAALPTSIAAAVYRITQESITNARRHSRSATFIDVDLAIDDEGVALDIVNDGTPSTRNSGGGFGLIGMAERVESLGGTLLAEPRPATGWRVSARIPLKRPV